MQQSKTVDVLDVALLEIETKRILFGKEMHSVQGLCLCLCNGRNIGTALLGAISREMTTRVLYDDMSIVLIIVQKRALGIARVSSKAGQIFG